MTTPKKTPRVELRLRRGLVTPRIEEKEELTQSVIITRRQKNEPQVETPSTQSTRPSTTKKRKAQEISQKIAENHAWKPNLIPPLPVFKVERSRHQDDAPAHVFVKELWGTRWRLPMTETVEQLKEEIIECAGVDVEEQTLVFNGFKLQDDDKLDQIVQSGGIITLVKAVKRHPNLWTHENTEFVHVRSQSKYHARTMSLPLPEDWPNQPMTWIFQTLEMDYGVDLSVKELLFNNQVVSQWSTMSDSQIPDGATLFLQKLTRRIDR